MNLIPLTLLFIMLFAFLSTMRHQEYKGVLLSNQLFVGASFQNQAAVAKELKKKADALHAALNPKEGKQGGAKTSQYLLLSAIGHQSSAPPDEEKLKATTLLFRKLLINLYGDQRFFQEAFASEEALDDFIEQIHKCAISLTDLGEFKRAQDIGNAPMRTEALQIVLYKMLKGKMAPEFEENSTDEEAKKDPEEYPPLTSYVNLLNRGPLVFVYGASPEVLRTVFDNPETIQRINSVKKEYRKKLKGKKGTERAQLLQTLNADFRMQFEKEIPSGMNPAYIDFTISGS